MINTGMAITMDIGSPTTIHPSNKQDVGDRLARLALAKDYNKDILASGLLYQSYRVQEGKVVIDFIYDKGLMSYKSSLAGFEFAGEDQIYVSAEAKIVNNQVIAWSDLVSDPKYVRYGWRDYFEGTLFNG
jgi:sialate O-acetylesterase